MTADTGGMVARGIAWMLLARIADRLAGILSIAVLARFISPNDFGMFQMALVIVVLAELFTMLGFDWALIRHPNPTREHFDTAFTLQLIVSVAASLLVLALAKPFAAYYRTPELVEPAMVLALLPLITAANNLAIAHLRREMRFEADFWRMSVPRLLSFVVGVVLAVWWQNYWALIGATLVVKGTMVGMGYVLHPYRPRLALSKWRELMSFSVWMQISNSIELLRLRAADLIVGRLMGSHSLAIYNVSMEVVTMPLSEFVGGMNSAVFSKYSRLQNDIGQLRNAYLDILGLTLLAGLPVAAGLYLVAPAAVRLLLGPAWSDGATMVQIIAFGALANSIAMNSGFVLLSVGRPNLNTIMSSITLVLLVVLLWTLSNSHGLKGAAFGFLLASLLSLPAHLAVLRYAIGVKLIEILKRTWRSFAATAIMSAALAPVVPQSAPETIAGAVAALALAVPLGAAVYCISIAALWLISGRPHSLEVLLFNAANDIFSRTSARLLGRGAGRL